MEPTKGDKIVIIAFSIMTALTTLLFQIYAIHKLEVDGFSTIFMIIGSSLISSTLGQLHYRYFINQIKNQ